MASEKDFIKLLKERFYYLNDLLKKEPNREKRFVILQDMRDIRQTIFENKIGEPNDFSLLDLYQNNKKDFYSIYFLWDAFERMYENTSGAPKLDLDKVNFSNEELISLASNFFEFLGEPFSRTIMEFLNKPNWVNFSLNNEDYAGMTLYLKSIDEVYINLQKDNSLYDYITIIHELTHAFTFKFQSSYKGCYDEIETSFMELVAAFYYFEQNKSKESFNFLKYLLNRYRLFAIVSHKMISLIKIEQDLKSDFADETELRNFASLKLYLNENKLEHALENASYIKRYFTCRIFALELFMIYIQNKDVALDILSKIINLRYTDDLQYYNNLIKLGLIPSRSLKDFISLIKNIEKENNKRILVP